MSYLYYLAIAQYQILSVSRNRSTFSHYFLIFIYIVPLVDEDIDGIPLDPDAEDGDAEERSVAGFVPSRWESVEPATEAAVVEDYVER